MRFLGSDDKISGGEWREALIFKLTSSFSSARLTKWCKVNILNVASSFLHPQAPRRSSCRYLRIHFRNDYRLILSGYRHYPFLLSSLSWDSRGTEFGGH